MKKSQNNLTAFLAIQDKMKQLDWLATQVYKLFCVNISMFFHNPKTIKVLDMQYFCIHFVLDIILILSNVSTKTFWISQK